MIEKVGIAGAGTYGAVLASYLTTLHHIKIVGYFDDAFEHGSIINGLPVVGSLNDAYTNSHVDSVICSIGNNQIRNDFCENATNHGKKLMTFIHPKAEIGPDVKLGRGLIIMPGALIMPFVKIGDYSVISMGCKIAHHTQLGSSNFVSTGANVGAGIQIGDLVLVGIGATIMTGVKFIASKTIIGAGSVVIRDISERSVVAGVPAKEIKKYT